METFSSSKGLSKPKGLNTKTKKSSEAFKDELTIQKAYLQKITNEDQESNHSDEANSITSTTKPKTCDLNDSQDPYDI